MGQMVEVNLRMDAELKNQAEELFDDLGFDIQTAVNIFIKQAVRDQTIPFTVSRKVRNLDTLEAMHELEAMKADPDSAKTYTDVDEMMRELLADV